MLQILLLHAHAESVPTIAKRGVHGGRPVAIYDVNERNEVARNAQLEAFFQRIGEWFDVLSK